MRSDDPPQIERNGERPASEQPVDGPTVETDFGEAWVYESIVSALPGVELSTWAAVALQLGLFEVALVFIAWLYGLWTAALAGTAAVVVAGVGSVAMLTISQRTRALGLPRPYRRLLFGSSIEVVLAVLAFVALVTHLFVFDPARESVPLITELFGPRPPLVAVYLTLLVLWDLCYRIGTSWWTAVVSLWRSYRYRYDAETVRAYRRLDAINVGFAWTQVLLLPFILDQRVLLYAVAGHIVAVTVVSAAAIALCRTSR